MVCKTRLGNIFEVGFILLSDKYSDPYLKIKIRFDENDFSSLGN